MNEGLGTWKSRNESYITYYIRALHSIRAVGEKERALLAKQLERQTKACFGRNLRSKRLGSRHVDKGIYIDQLLRWFVSFHPKQFAFIALGNFSMKPFITVSTIIQFMGIRDDPLNLIDQISGKGADRIAIPAVFDHFVEKERKLTRPNNLSDLSENTLSSQELTLLEGYYRPYERALAMLFRYINA